MGESEYAVWLYGSHARGTADEYSDVDVLFVAADEQQEVDVESLWVGSGSFGEVSMSRYSWCEVEQMAAYGSLFLWHIRMEGRPIVETGTAAGRLASILSNLGPYQLARRDLVGFATVVRDVEESIRDEHASLTFEASTLGTVFRHACILGCALEGRPCFSRQEPVERLAAAWKLPTGWARCFPELYRYRLYADGRVMTIDGPERGWIRTWCARTRRLLEELGERVR